MRYRVNPSSDAPPSRQIVEQVLDRVAAQILVPGAQLPSVRALAAEALVNPNTAAKAIRDLEMLGVVEGRNGLGVFVTGRGPALARAQRRRATLEKLELALSEALRAGHASEALQELVERVIDANGVKP